MILNYSNLARDIGVDDVTVKNYFSILEDTLLGTTLPAHHNSIRKRQRGAPKFYFFDVGLCHYYKGLSGKEIDAGTYGYGNAFENFIILEIKRLASYAEKNWEFSYLRTSGDAEIDLIIESPGEKTILIEIKSSQNVDEKTINSLQKFSASFPHSRAIIISREIAARRVENVEILPWKKAFDELGI